VFVLTHHARTPFTEGGTTFHFVTDGLQSALKRAKEAAGDGDVRIGGGVSVIRQYLMADQIDEMDLAVSPVLLGEGEHLFSGINLPKLGFNPFRTVAGENATHVILKRA
jgi:dihydrofolate reductase